jgi:hypothetical protein
MNVKISLSGFFCNTWPDCVVVCNGHTIFQDKIINDNIIDFTIDFSADNLLTIGMTNKLMGENSVYDILLDAHNNIIEDKYIKVNDILFDDVSVDNLIHEFVFIKDSNEKISTSGNINYNGSIHIPFQQPIYDWLIQEKYIKKEIQETNYQGFGSWNNKFNYDVQDLIKKLETIV